MITCLCPVGFSGQFCEITDMQCPLHGCTPERLGCRNSELKVDEKGCTLCECKQPPTTPTPFVTRLPITIAPRLAPRQCLGGKVYSDIRVCQQQCNTASRRCARGCVC